MSESKNIDECYTLSSFKNQLSLSEPRHQHIPMPRWGCTRKRCSEAGPSWKKYTLILGVLSISSKHLNFLDLELKENSRKIKLLEIGLEDRRSVDPNLCPKNHKTFLLSISAVFVMQFLLEFTWFLELNWQVNRINSRSRQVTYNNTTNRLPATVHDRK